jgi:hypothetical protein
MFASFAERSTEAELMDGAAYSFAEFLGGLADLRRINRYLGGQRALARHLFPMIEALGRQRVRVLDVGTGSADIPAMVVRWARRRQLRVEFVVLDLNEYTAREARAQTARYPEISVVRADARRLPFAERSFDLVTASLFLHHFDTPLAAQLMASFARVARVAFIINDLRRHPVAYYSIKLLTRLLLRNRLVRHDAALSVRRGFTERDVAEIARQAAVPLRVSRHFPYRLILIGQR